MFQTKIVDKTHFIFGNFFW